MMKRRNPLQIRSRNSRILKFSLTGRLLEKGFSRSNSKANAIDIWNISKAAPRCGRASRRFEAIHCFFKKSWEPNICFDWIDRDVGDNDLPINSSLEYPAPHPLWILDSLLPAFTRFLL
jgi:hypothetical protein